MKEKFKDFLLAFMFTFIRPHEEWFYDGKPETVGFKENLDQYMRWYQFHETKGYRIRHRIWVTITTIVFAIVFFFCVMFVKSCNRYCEQVHKNHEEFAKKIGADPNSIGIPYAYDITEFLKKNNKKVHVIANVVKDYPVILAEQEVDGCEYFICFTDTSRGHTVVSVVHKGNCKSPAHKK